MQDRASVIKEIVRRLRAADWKTIWFIFMIAGAAVSIIAAVLLVRDLRNR